MFQGFTQRTVDFMWGIRFNNQRDWFMSHKEDYQNDFLAPVKELGQQVYDGLREKYPDEPLMLKVSRIYRDARRLHGRGPYKDHLWWCIRTGGEDWTGRPTFWFELGPDYYSYGLGFWAPKAALLEAYRKEIDRDPAAFTALVQRFNKQKDLTLQGEEYKKPKGDVGALLNPWYQKKNLMLCFEGPLDERIYSPHLADEILCAYQEIMPFYQWLSRVAATLPAEERTSERKR